LGIGDWGLRIADCGLDGSDGSDGSDGLDGLDGSDGSDIRQRNPVDGELKA